MTSTSAGTTSAAAAADAVPAAPHRPHRGRTHRARGHAPFWQALIWLAPALVLIGAVVVYPAIAMIQASTKTYSITGLEKGSVGTDNYRKVLDHPDLATVLVNTLVWVVAVVTITIVLGLALAQFLSKEFFGRRVVRWALIVPWAASLVITSRLFTLLLDYYHGIVNKVLVGLGLLDKPVDFLGDDSWVMPSMIVVGVFVSLPFTAYVFIAGLNGISHEVLEAARIDGASSWQTYRHVTLPLLRPALLVATVLNIIYVFNSFPVVYTLNERNPGFEHDTTITFMYKLAFKSAELDVGMSAATGVFNVLLILVVVVIYLKTVKWQEEPGS
ncbi:carbohydrate ABC transporter membrane protein 1, CUT1 family [Jatrophihabitans endophyticus]|uniref:Carbohydrate ABC transporter membrane protein 1, CUT1 family n=1 Tax=Jatrophihabitans endophyticus TaxID=1206085 RepID=A0A1M5HEB2_9ACTN|nr:sugar ABC transporter permease [Jatrophihabitans endophyticus]SHG14319.1 carbohydrate ABC transporter membrane protein 1, CUT1 family [Jatrophihabitans endophyticus]